MGAPNGEPTPDTGDGEPTEPTPATEPSDRDEPDWKAEAEKWKVLARKHEKIAKSNLAELQKLKQQQQPQDVDGDGGDADDSGSSEIATALSRAWAAEVKAEVAILAPSLGIDPAALWRSPRIRSALGEYLDERDDIDALDVDSDEFRAELRKALGELVEDFPRIRMKTGPRPDPSQGSRGGLPSGAELDAQIAEAQKRGDWRTAIALKNQKIAALAAKQQQ